MPPKITVIVHCHHSDKFFCPTKNCSKSKVSAWYVVVGGAPAGQERPPAWLTEGHHLNRSERKESSTAGSASIRSPSSMSRDSGSILSGSSRENGSISNPGT